jgi:hypothetical protein
MKGIHASPHYLQILILLFSSFYLLASCTASIYEAITSCRYLVNDHDDANETNHEYSIDCIGSSITASSYGITALLTLFGVVVAAITGTDVDLMIAFVIFGILLSYTSDVYTNLRINCVAGDTTSQNMWDDDQYDSSAQKCEILTYGAIGGTIGVLGGFIGGYYGVLMKLKPGTFYPQRPLGLLLALAGYSSIYCFNMLATALPYCHYYSQGKEDQIPDNIPPKINDDLVYNQLDPLCEGYRNTSIGYGAGVFISLLGIPVMFRFKKRGLWIILGCFMAICSASNRFTFMAAKLSSCDSTDNLLSDLGAYTSYQKVLFSNGCKNYSNAATVSIFATLVGSSAALISFFDTALHIEHDTLLIRFRRALFFAFGFCFSLSNLFNLHGSYYSDCQLYEKKLNDDVIYEESDDVVMRAKCHGKLTQTIFYGISIVTCGIGILISLIYNFPVDNDKEITIMNLDDREADAEELIHPHHHEQEEEYAKLLQEDEEGGLGHGGVKGNEDHRILVESYRV